MAPDAAGLGSDSSSKRQEMGFVFQLVLVFLQSCVLSVLPVTLPAFPRDKAENPVST